MENPIPAITQSQKKQKSKGFTKSAQNVQPKQQAALVSAQQAQGQQAQQSNPKAV